MVKFHFIGVLGFWGNEVLQEVDKKDENEELVPTDGDGIKGRQVGLDLGDEQEVHLVLGRGLRGPGAGEQLHLLALVGYDLVCALHVID